MCRLAHELMERNEAKRKFVVVIQAVDQNKTIASAEPNR